MKRDLAAADTEFIKYCIEQLEIQTSPVIRIGDDHSKAQEFGAMGYYSPADNFIWVLRGYRVPADWYRTLAHELVHWRQRELGQEMDGSDGSDLENEANSKAAVILRAWGRDNRDIYIIGSEPGSDRTHFYLEYYSNLSPTGFELSRVGDEIRIKVPQAEPLTPGSID